MSELIFSSSLPNEAYKISRFLKKKEIRKIARRIYTSNFTDDPSDIIRRNILEILGALYPGSVLSHRSAFEFKPTHTNQIFVTYSYTKKINLPGITINFLSGKGPVEEDSKMIGGLFVSSEPRRFLENLQISKKSGPDSKTIGTLQIEEKLDDILRIKGETALNSLRDKAKRLAPVLGLEKEFEQLNKICGALLRTKPSKILKSDLAASRSAGKPYDRHRLELFEVLFHYLYGKTFAEYPEKNISFDSYRYFAFFESYFSNYIEGTVFEVSEAREIIETGIPLPSRGGDSHDILGTYFIASDRKEMSRTAENETELLTILKKRHLILMSARPERNPGEFKTLNNRAGDTSFVDTKLVQGTLERGFNYLKVLSDPFSRAAYMKFLISEVHPFTDGNGRIARIMMNAELTSRNQSKIIIPTVYREDYLLALKKLSRQKDPAPYVEMMSKAHRFSAGLSFESYDDFYIYLRSRNAFREPDEGIKLIVDF